MLKNTLVLRVIVTAIAFVMLAIYWVWPNIGIDGFILILVMAAIFPWLSPLIKSAEFPGGLKIEFREIKSAARQINQEPQKEDNSVIKIQTSRPSFLSVADRDANLALVGLRIEIEKRLRLLAAKNGLQDKQPNIRLINQLLEASILDESSAEGLIELIRAGNDAAHGAEVETKITNWAFDEGVRILSSLDMRIAQSKLPPDQAEDLNNWLDDAVVILNFEGQQVYDHAADLLRIAQQEGKIKHRTQGAYISSKLRAVDVLVRLGALETIGNQKSTRFAEHHVITPKGEALLSKLLAAD